MDKKLDEFAKKKMIEFLDFIDDNENINKDEFKKKYLKQLYYKINTENKPIKKQERNYRNIQKKYLK